MKKTTARAHSNIAFIKYWGKKDEILRLPTNGSISMNLSGLYTDTTVEFIPSLTQDDITIDGKKDAQKALRVTSHLDRVRALGKTNGKARVVSQSNFPSGAGLSSSASGFASLTVAATQSLGLTLSERELSILARLGSGSACRSIPDGFVEWKDATTSEESYAETLFPHDYWDIVDIVVLTSAEQKYIPTSQGQERAKTSIFFQERLRHMKNKIEQCRRHLQERDFTALGILSEMEALEMHAVMITSWPALLYWLPGTLAVMQAVQKWREEGLAVYFTINTGQNVHILCQQKDKEQVMKLVSTLPDVQKVIANQVSRGTYLIMNP